MPSSDPKPGPSNPVFSRNFKGDGESPEGKQDIQSDFIGNHKRKELDVKMRKVEAEVQNSRDQLKHLAEYYERKIEEKLSFVDGIVSRLEEKLEDENQKSNSKTEENMVRNIKAYLNKLKVVRFYPNHLGSENEGHQEKVNEEVQKLFETIDGELIHLNEFYEGERNNQQKTYEEIKNFKEAFDDLKRLRRTANNYISTKSKEILADVVRSTNMLVDLVNKKAKIRQMSPKEKWGIALKTSPAYVTQMLKEKTLKEDCKVEYYKVEQELSDTDTIDVMPTYVISCQILAAWKAKEREMISPLVFELLCNARKEDIPGIYRFEEITDKRYKLSNDDIAVLIHMDLGEKFSESISRFIKRLNAIPDEEIEDHLKGLRLQRLQQEYQKKLLMRRSGKSLKELPNIDIEKQVDYLPMLMDESSKERKKFDCIPFSGDEIKVMKEILGKNVIEIGIDFRKPVTLRIIMRKTLEKTGLLTDAEYQENAASFIFDKQEASNKAAHDCIEAQKRKHNFLIPHIAETLERRSERIDEERRASNKVTVECKKEGKELIDAYFEEIQKQLQQTKEQDIANLEYEKDIQGKKLTGKIKKEKKKAIEDKCHNYMKLMNNFKKVAINNMSINKEIWIYDGIFGDEDLTDKEKEKKIKEKIEEENRRLKLIGESQNITKQENKEILIHGGYAIVANQITSNISETLQNSTLLSSASCSIWNSKNKNNVGTEDKGDTLEEEQRMRLA